MNPVRTIHSGRLSDHLALAQKLTLTNRTAEAIRRYQWVLAQHPEHLGAALGARLTLPVIYESCEAVQAARNRIESGLHALLGDMDRFLRLPPHQCLDQLLWVNFFLAYQGQDDIVFQGMYGDFVAKLVGAHLPALTQPLPRRKVQGRRIRVGFASSYFRQCTVGGYFRRWVTHLDRERFETFVYHSDPRQDAVTRGIAAQCEHFVAMTAPGYETLDACGKRILADELDILIYTELGMDARTFLLASLRLAPVQCAGWGHPVTSGLASIDYYLSCRDAEPPEAAGHYREALVLLDGLGVSYPRPVCPLSKTRRDFGLSDSNTVYLCPQSLFKLHPDFDTLLARVLAGDTNGMLVLFEADSTALTHCFMNRLAKTFVRFDLDIRRRVAVLPYLRHPDYLEVNRLCDVMLDPLYWSGGNTSLDALASGLPVVTFEGRFMRGRQTAAMLRRLGLEQLIAHDPDDYVRIAHALAHDSGLRSDVRGQLRDRVDALFDQEAALVSFDDFLVQATNV